MTNWRTVFATGILALQFYGCSSAPTLDVKGQHLWLEKKIFREKYQELAKIDEANGSLRLALNKWRAINAVYPEDSEPRAEIDRLQQVISSRISKQLRAAESAFTSSNPVSAKRQLLKVLALQPDHQKAIEGLKKLEATSAYRKMASAPRVSNKLIQAYGESEVSADEDSTKTENTPARKSPDLAPYAPAVVPPPPPDDKSGNRRNLELGLGFMSKGQYSSALTHFLLARKSNESSEAVVNKRIAEARELLVEQHYGKGVSEFRMGRYDISVAEFKKALEYDPKHQKARLYLRSATKMQKLLTP